ncbi:unnamed protein product [Paramecium sonneborni]|uniref:Cyclin-like domain-containing protein n=1 Tax=Paramecium sonneborni TaxID=65129 RepID=A0A8S1QAI7_9CILI|nr:unnamed protein product [Paramecium sonneborni]
MSLTEQQEYNYDAQYLETFGCNHSTRQIHSEKLICQQCGIFINNSTTRVYKTTKMKYNTFFNPLKILGNILTPLTIAQHQITRLPIIDFLEQTSERLNLSTNTTFLAITYIDHFFNKVSVDEKLIFLYAAAALMLAAKAQELDEKIPFISKLKRYSSLTPHPEINNFTTQEFCNAEKALIESLNWKLQKITLLDRIESLLSFGVIDDDDSLSQPPQQKENKDSQFTHIKLRDLDEKQIINYVNEVENKYIETAYSVIRDDQIYFSNDQTILALSCIAFLRKKAGLLNIWSQQLQALTGESAQKISATVSQIMTLTPKSISKPLINTQSSSYLNNYQISSSQHKNSYMKNRQYLFESNKSSAGDIISQYNTTAKTHLKAPLFQTQSTMQLQQKSDICKHHQINQTKYSSRNSNFTTTNNYSYLTDNIVHPNSFMKHAELDKKYEQLHKVSETKFKTKIFS